MTERKPRILLIGTGGTIASKQTGSGLAPVLSLQELLELAPEAGTLCRLEARQLFNLDSTNMDPPHWLELARCIQNSYTDYDGFVVTHGTDTMAYAAATLSYLIQQSPKPVVLTGAQKSIDERDSDARGNLIGAVRLAADPRAQGVCVYFDGKAIAGTRARKLRSKSYNAFSSIDYPELAVLLGDRLVFYIQEPKPVMPRFYQALDSAVFVCKLIPGMDPGVFDYAAEHCHAVILESFGVGGIPYYDSPAFADKIELLIRRGVKVIVSTQVLHEGSDMEVYSVGFKIKRQYELLEAYDMTPEAIVAKTMWALAAAEDEQAFRRLFRTPVGKDLL